MSYRPHSVHRSGQNSPCRDVGYVRRGSFISQLPLGFDTIDLDAVFIGLFLELNNGDFDKLDLDDVFMGRFLELDTGDLDTPDLDIFDLDVQDLHAVDLEALDFNTLLVLFLVLLPAYFLCISGKDIYTASGVLSHNLASARLLWSMLS